MIINVKIYNHKTRNLCLVALFTNLKELGFVSEDLGEGLSRKYRKLLKIKLHNIIIIMQQIDENSADFLFKLESVVRMVVQEISTPMIEK